MLVPSTVLQRIVGDCDTRWRNEGGRERERKKEKLVTMEKNRERERAIHHQGAVPLYYY